MGSEVLSTQALIDSAARGSDHARQSLLNHHRRRLCQMVALRIDPRLAPRLDPSDVVQEALADAAGKLDVYFRDRPLPFYPWLHRLALERLAQAYRRHVKAQSRAVGREQAGGLGLPNGSAFRLVDRLVASGTSPSQRMLLSEQRQQMREALGVLAPNDREVLVMFYLEGLAFAEIAAILGVSEGAAKVRHFRALKRIRKLLAEGDGSTVR